MSEGIPVEVSANRDPRLPKLVRFAAGAHPLWPGEVLVYMEDPLRLRDNFNFFASRTIPSTQSRDDLLSAGYFELLPGVAIFCRNVRGTGNPEDDVIKAFVISEGVLDMTHGGHVDALRHLRHEMLGPREGRVGAMKGGIPFERMPNRNTNTAQGKRCYTTLLSVQKQRGVAAPSKNVSGGYLADGRDEDLDLITRFNEVRSRRSFRVF